MDPPVRISLKCSKNDDTKEASTAPQLDSSNGLLQDHRVERFYSHVFSSGNYSYHHNGNIDDKKKMKRRRMHTRQLQHLPLPLDIQGEIMTRLPATSILRLRSVCRDWNIMSQSPSFRLANLAHAKKTHLIVHLGDYYEEGHQVHLIETIDKKNVIFRLGPFPWNLNNLMIIGSCNGILCLLEYVSKYAKFYLYNPLLGGDYLKLPEHPIMHKHGYINYGFCFDDLRSEFKVVIIIVDDGRYDEVTHSIDTCSIPMVGEHIGTPQPWKVVKTGVLLNISINPIDPLIFLKGKLYGTANSNLIISFDVASEEIALLPPLYFVNGNDFSGLNLRELDGHLLTIHFTTRPNDWILEIWVMEDLNNSNSWTKLFSFHHQKKMMSPYVFNKDEIFLFSYANKPHMVELIPSLISIPSAKLISG